MIIESENCQTSDPIGGKASALASLAQEGFRIPRWFVIPDGDFDLPTLKGLYAVRSSAMAEDGEEQSYAGQYESYLNVEPAEIREKIEAVRESGRSERVRSYRGEVGGDEVAVIVQEMIDPRVSGVAFGADPVTGNRELCLVSAVEGLGEALVSGELNSQDWKVDREGHLFGESRLLSSEAIHEVASLCRECGRHFGRPQDIEWAIDQEGVLWLLQSRAITTLAKLPDPSDELTIWDNSNIAESYGGVTTPLTFSFASRIYEHVYREFCQLLSVPRGKLEKHDEVFPMMLGLIKGRTYYNLVSWYRVLALLPGFSMNRGFMEKMMGVKEALPEEVVDKVVAESRTNRWRDGLAMGRSSLSLVRSYLRLPRQIREFRKRLDSALDLKRPLSEMKIGELIEHYEELEKRLLKKWDAPLVNDFFAMIFYGIFSKKCDDVNVHLQDLGDIISARPPKLIKEMAGLIDAETAGVFADAEVATSRKLSLVRQHAKLAEKFEGYLEEFGDRCLDELKLESASVSDDPASLLLSIGGFALRPAKKGEEVEEPELDGYGLRWLRRQTQRLIRNRENLRFERTRVFGRVRQVMRELGKRLVADGQLELVDDVFYLELDEVLETGRTQNFRALVEARREEFENYRNEQAPPDRFETRGPLHRYEEFSSEKEEVGTGDLLGVGACPGVVRGRVRVVDAPRGACLEAGEILVAKQTDPGWVVLFPAASGLLVERGSLLSHSAIVARELQLPCIVALSGITQRLETGDLVEMNGRTGEVTLIDDED